MTQVPKNNADAKKQSKWLLDLLMDMIDLRKRMSYRKHRYPEAYDLIFTAEVEILKCFLDLTDIRKNRK